MTPCNPSAPLLLACLLLPPALAIAPEPANPTPQPQLERTSDVPLVTRLSHHVGSEHASNEHPKETRHHCTDCESSNSRQSHHALTCTAQCPICPTCLPTQACPSPCPTIPKCPEASPCPTPCAACPSCPACKKPIPNGYEHFKGLGYYRLHTVPVDWMTAKETCEREGAHLAIINSQAEANLMKTLFSRDPDIGNWLYLGFHDLYKEGKYVTLFGAPLTQTGYITWSNGQPDNHHNNENCGSMYPSGGLNDLDCSSKQPFVCEFPV